MYRDLFICWGGGGSEIRVRGDVGVGSGDLYYGS